MGIKKAATDKAKNAVKNRSGNILPFYNGFLSSYEEWHALGIGIYYGRREEYTTLPDYLWDVNHPRYNEDVEHEPQYAYYGFDVGETYRRHNRKIWIGATALFLLFIDLVFGTAKTATILETATRLVAP